MNDPKLLSLVVPTYKQGRTIEKNILSLEKSLNEVGFDYEIIVVVDGIVDDSVKKLNRIKSKKIKILSYDQNIGKGYAVRYGMLQAKGDVIGFIDGGVDINPTGIEMLLNHMMWYDADIIVGSKLHPVSKVKYPFYRKVLSWGYRTMTRMMFGFKVRDTQVGLKLFKRKVVRQVFPRLLVKQFAFDVEILAVSYSLGYKKIYEAPIVLNFRGASSINAGTFWKIISHMLWDTLAVFYRIQILHYYTNDIKFYKRNH